MTMYVVMCQWRKPTQNGRQFGCLAVCKTEEEAQQYLDYPLTLFQDVWIEETPLHEEGQC